MKRFSIIAGLAFAFASLGQAEAQEALTQDISHINGTPVKVGEHNEYHYSFRRWNVSANPLGWVFGIYGASVSYGFHDHVAVRGDFTVLDPIESDSGGYQYSISAPIYFRRTYQGLFLEPGLMVRRIDTGDSVTETMGPGVMLGWHWTWDSGLNFSMAFGFGRNLRAEDGDDYHDSGDDELYADGYLRFGYAF